MSHIPAKLALVKGGKLKRGDTVEPWPFKIAAIPSPADAVVKFSLHLENLANAPLFELASPADFAVAVENTTVGGVEMEAVLTGQVPRINAPAVGTLVWELQVRVPSLSVAGPEGGEWTRTVFEGTIIALQDGADRTLP